MSSRAKRAQVVDLLEWRKNHTTINHLRTLLRDAEQGKVVGILVAAHYDDDEYLYAGAGSLCDVPVLGAAAAQNLLKKMLA